MGLAIAKRFAVEGLALALLARNAAQIGGFVTATAFDPGRIAEPYWALHTQAPGSWQTGRVFDGKPD